VSHHLEKPDTLLQKPPWKPTFSCQLIKYMPPKEHTQHTCQPLLVLK
jgi:hypothetical protein